VRQALTNLAEQGDQIFEQYAGKVLSNPWVTRDDYLALRNNWEKPEVFWKHHCKRRRIPADRSLLHRTRQLLEAQYYQQYSFTSCGFFFEDLDRIEPRNDIAYARRAISLYWQALGIDLQSGFVRDLEQAKSWRTGFTGTDLYKQLPVVYPDLLPPLS
jgi:hypothetical protein